MFGIKLRGLNERNHEELWMSRRVVGNATSVMAVQAGSYILPLINVPYLLRVIGPEHYGLIAFSQAVMMYFVTLNDYGFNLSATRELAVRRDDAVLRSELYSAVMTIKASLCLVSFLILCTLIHFVPRFHNNSSVFFASFGIVVGTTMFPQWFFQGIEKMYWISVVNLTSNLVFTLGIYVLVHDSSDYLICFPRNTLSYRCPRLLSYVTGSWTAGICSCRPPQRRCTQVRMPSCLDWCVV
jgi:PST family polysaccharide transporter